MHPVVECVAGFLAERNTTAATRVLVGCSGGPDSVALAHATAAVRASGQVGEVILVYVDHQLRDGSAADGAYVQQLAARLGVEAVVEQVTVARDQASLEAAARQARYAAFEALVERWDATAVLLAHTRTDQAETVLMRVLRGTGVTGLAAMQPVRDHYWRPLLSLPRERIAAYCADHGLAPLRDPMNDDERYLRVRVRRHIMPLLAAENPAIVDALVRLAAAAAEQRATSEFAAKVLLARAGDGGDLATDIVAAAPDGVVKRALALAAVAAGGEPLEARHQQALLELVRRPAAGSVSLDLPGTTALREYGRLRFGTSRSPVAPAAAVQGADGPYCVRCWQAGDRMCPARLKGRSRKLSDLFVDAKVPKALRANAVVVTRERDGEIVWAQFVGPAFGSAVEVTLTTYPPTATNND